MKNYLLISFFFFSILCSGQVNKKLDSLTIEYNKDSLSISTTRDLAYELMFVNPKKSISLSKKGLKLNPNKEDESGLLTTLCQSYTLLGKFEEALKINNRLLAKTEKNKSEKRNKIYAIRGGIYASLNNKDSCLFYMENKIKINSENPTLQDVKNMINLGAFKISFSQYEEANNLFFKILKRIENKKIEHKEHYLGTIYTNIARSFGYLGDYTRAEFYFEKSESEFKKANLDAYYFQTTVSHSQNFIDLKKIKEGVQFIEDKLNDKQIDNFLRYKAGLLHNLAKSYSILKQNNKALKYLNEAMVIDSVYNPSYGIMTDLSLKIEILQSQGKYIQASKVINDLKEYSVENDDDKVILLKAKILNDLNLIRNKEIADEFSKYIALRDSIEKHKLVEKSTDLSEKYQTQQKENKILKLANENEKQKVAMARTRLLLFSIIGLVTALGGLTYFIRQKRKQKQQLQLLEKTIEASDNEKNRIGRELHDGIASKILQLVHNAENLNEEYTHKLQDVYTEIRGLSHQLNQTPMHSEEPIFERLLEITDAIQQKVNLEITPISLIVKEPIATHIYRIIQELVTNTIKHARASNITLNLSQSKNDLVLKYTDDGKGFSNEVKGKGLLNIEHRVNVLKGEITYKTEPKNGFSTQITIPV